MIHEIKILLACGNGASSGYLATQVRKAAKKKEKQEVFAL